MSDINKPSFGKFFFFKFVHNVLLETTLELYS